MCLVSQAQKHRISVSAERHSLRVSALTQNILQGELCHEGYNFHASSEKLEKPQATTSNLFLFAFAPICCTTGSLN